MGRIRRVIIIGGVAGGASCATRLRRHDEEVDILLLERGPHVSFANCGLPYFIGGVIEEEKSLFLSSVDQFRERFRIDARVLSEAIKVNRDKNTVSVLDHQSGETYDESYDYLVLAPGAKPIRPSLPGIDLEGIFSLRNVPDSNKIKNWIRDKNVKRAVVVGGGFIGLEMIENLMTLGIHTTLVESDRQILPALDQEMTIPLRNTLHQYGVAVYLGETVTSFSQQGDVLHVHTKRGKKLACEMVILAVGVVPENELAEDCGLELGPRGHIVVDKNMQSSDPCIYAIGDCIQVKNVISRSKIALPLAGPANRQGRIVADTLAGRGRFFRGVQGTAICGFFEITAATTGVNEKFLQGQTEIEYTAVYAHPLSHVGYYPGATPLFTKLLYDKSNGRILGAQIVGNSDVARRIDVISMAIQMKATVFDIEESELCYAPQYGAAKDPVNVIGMIAANEMRGDLKIVHWDNMGGGNAVILDVRDTEEVNTRALPNAIHIPLNELRERLGEIPTDKPIHVSCAVGARAYNAVRLLQNLGYQASLLSGGEQTFGHLTSCHGSSASCWAERDKMDFLVSWQVMRDTLGADNPKLGEFLSTLRNPKVFVTLPLENVAEAFHRMDAIDVKKGDVIMVQGKPGDFFYIIKSGQAEVWQMGLYDNEQKLVAIREAGEHLGEEALITGGMRTATVKMATDGILLRLSRDDFQELITKEILEEVNIESMQKLLGEGCKVLDVRYEEEYEEEHIPNVQLIPLPELRDRIDELDSKNRYVTVCLSGKRSAVASMILRQNRIKAVSLKGGLREWPGEMISEY